MRTRTSSLGELGNTIVTPVWIRKIYSTSTKFLSPGRTLSVAVQLHALEVPSLVMTEFAFPWLSNFLDVQVDLGQSWPSVFTVQL
jgi:hypothetical protein